MKRTALSILLLAALGPAATAQVVERAPQPTCHQATTTPEQQLQTTLEAYNTLSELHAICNGISQDDTPATIRAATTRLRPLCARLQSLSTPQQRQICLLADAIIWQRDWVYCTYLAEHGITLDPEDSWGLELLAQLADKANRRMQSPRTTAEEKAAWGELLALFGGKSALPIPRQLLNSRLAKDYKTALAFFKDFCAAVAATNETQCLQQLQEQARVLDYLLQGGEADRLRLTHLLTAFAQARQNLRADGLLRPDETCPPLPLSQARAQALEPFFTRLPALRELLP